MRNAHIDEGQLRAYLDHELGGPEREQVKAHLSGCPECQAQVETLSARARRVGEHLAALTPLSSEAPIPAEAARVQLQKRITEKENIPMWNKLFKRTPRVAWAGLAVILVLAAAMAFPQVRAIADGFLGLFRVQQITLVQFDPNELQNRLGSSAQFETLISKDVQIDPVGKTQTVTSAGEASAAAGIPVRLPSQIDGSPQISVQAGEHATFTIDLPTLRSVLNEIGLNDLKLPNNLNGATVTMDLPQAVVAKYGQCNQSLGNPDAEGNQFQLGNCTTLIQLASPTISAPADLDLNRIGTAFLQLLGMTPQQAAQFSQNVDWTTTLVVPVPSNSGVSYQDAQVDGVKATQIQQTFRVSSGVNQTMTTLVWIKDGIVYALTSSSPTSTVLDIANSLK